MLCSATDEGMQDARSRRQHASSSDPPRWPHPASIVGAASAVRDNLDAPWQGPIISVERILHHAAALCRRNGGLEDAVLAALIPLGREGCHLVALVDAAGVGVHAAGQALRDAAALELEARAGPCLGLAGIGAGDARLGGIRAGDLDGHVRVQNPRALDGREPASGKGHQHNGERARDGHGSCEGGRRWGDLANDTWHSA
mmetsp:Transcript_17778/g.40175  ORF Transcript_17778/g.40175 Transcript_17778/m.40175 type:complete len:200 (-) Transcript_17778:6-605(-)